MPVTLLVLADPTDPHLGALERLPEETRIATGDSSEAFQGAAAEAEVILSWFAPRALLEEVWEMAPRVRWVHSSSVGVDTVLFPSLAESPVPLTNSRGIFSASLGEFAVASILFFAKDLRRRVLSQAAGVWDPADVEDVAGKTLGIVGYGDIGHAVARRAHALGMKVLAVRRRPERCGAEECVGAVFPPEARREVMAASDYVVAALPLTPETRGLIGEAELRAMKNSGVIINIGRGPAIDEATLVRALDEGWIRGAALDVFEQEPLPAGHPFYRLENVLLSPHCADHTPGWRDRAMEVFLDIFERFRKGEPLRNVVDKKSGY